MEYEEIERLRWEDDGGLVPRLDPSAIGNTTTFSDSESDQSFCRTVVLARPRQNGKLIAARDAHHEYCDVQTSETTIILQEESRPR